MRIWRVRVNWFEGNKLCVVSPQGGSVGSVCNPVEEVVNLTRNKPWRVKKGTTGHPDKKNGSSSSSEMAFVSGRIRSANSPDSHMGLSFARSEEVVDVPSNSRTCSIITTLFFSASQSTSDSCLYFPGYNEMGNANSWFGMLLLEPVRRDNVPMWPVQCRKTWPDQSSEHNLIKHF